MDGAGTATSWSPPSSNEMLPEERKALESLNIQAPSETAAPTIAAEVALEESESVVGGEVLMSFTDGSVKPIFESSFDKLLPGVPQFSVERYDVSPDASDDESPLYFMSADTRHKILSVAQANEKESLPTYVWEIYENGTENFIGKVRLHVSFSPFVVTGNRLVVELQPYSFVKSGDLIEEPMQIRAFDMQSGKQMWSEKTRDIYDLPDPPH